MDTKKTGFIKPIITSEHHVLGSNGIPLPIIKADGDWTNFLPEFESQLEPTFDPDDCTVAGTLYALSTLEKFVYGTNSHYSRRYVYNISEMAPPGTDPQVPITHIRGSGVINETDLTDTCSSLAEFMTPRPMDVTLMVKGQEFLKRHQVGHQWLWTAQPDQISRLAILREALTKGTVCVSVTAWYQNAQGLYYSPQGQDNGHWVHVYKVDETGIYVFDSYEGNNPSGPSSYLKKLTLDHNIQFAKVYFFTVPTQQQNWFSELITAFLELVGLKQKQLEQPMGVVPPYPPKVVAFCTAIAIYEGGKPSRHNPGNIRCNPYDQSNWNHLAIGVENGFCVFPDDATGVRALQEKVYNACTGKSRVYSPTDTIVDFFDKYAPTGDANNPKTYAKFVADHVGVYMTTQMKDLLT